MNQVFFIFYVMDLLSHTVWLLRTPQCSELRILATASVLGPFPGWVRNASIALDAFRLASTGGRGSIPSEGV